jgi:hypothetical protein
MADQFDGGGFAGDAGGYDDTDDAAGFDFDFEDDDGLEPAAGSYGGSADYGDGDGAGGWTPEQLSEHLANVAREAVAPYIEGAREHFESAVQAQEAQAWQAQQVEGYDQLEQEFPELQSFEDGDVGDQLQDALAERVRVVAQELGCAPSPALARRVFLEFQSDPDAAAVFEVARSRAIEDTIARAHGGHGGGSIERARREWAAEQQVAADDAIAEAYERSGRHRIER